MSKVKCMRCDKCGELIIGDDPTACSVGRFGPAKSRASTCAAIAALRCSGSFTGETR